MANSHNSSAQAEHADPGETAGPTDTGETTDSSSDSDSESAGPPAALEDLPASSEIVWIILSRADTPLTLRQITERCARPHDTVQYGLRRLRDETDLLDRLPTGDARTSAYTPTKHTSK